MSSGLTPRVFDFLISEPVNLKKNSSQFFQIFFKKKIFLIFKINLMAKFSSPCDSSRLRASRTTEIILKLLSKPSIQPTMNKN